MKDHQATSRHLLSDTLRSFVEAVTRPCAAKLSVTLRSERNELYFDSTFIAALGQPDDIRRHRQAYYQSNPAWPA